MHDQIGDGLENLGCTIYFDIDGCYPRMQADSSSIQAQHRVSYLNLLHYLIPPENDVNCTKILDVHIEASQNWKAITPFYHDYRSSLTCALSREDFIISTAITFRVTL